MEKSSSPMLDLPKAERVIPAVLPQRPVVIEADAERPRKPPIQAQPWHGWAIACAIAGAAYASQHLPVAPFRIVLESGAVRHPVGPALVAIVLGVLIRNTLRMPDAIISGSRAMSKRSIPWAIALIGAGLNLAVVASIGVASLSIVFGAIALAVIAALAAGRAARLRSRSSLLLASGTAICGNSAILAIAPIIKAREKEILVSIGVVNLIGLAFMVLLPAVGALVGMSGEQLGVWAGASIHSVPQAIAAGFAYPQPGAGEVATLVKLVRVAMLVPFVIVVTLLMANGNGGLHNVKVRKLMPWFIWGFLALAAANTFVQASGALPPEVATTLSSGMSWLNLTGGILLTISLGAIGLDVNLRTLTRVGKRALLVGVIASVAMAAGCYALIMLLM